MNRQPQTYHEWRQLWQSLAKHLGWHISYCIQFNEPLMNKRTWELYNQMYRVRLRLMAEAEAYTESFLQALSEILFNENV